MERREMKEIPRSHAHPFRRTPKVEHCSVNALCKTLLKRFKGLLDSRFETLKTRVLSLESKPRTERLEALRWFCSGTLLDSRLKM